VSTIDKYCPQCGAQIQEIKRSGFETENRDAHEHKNVVRQPSGLMFCKTCGKYVNATTGEIMDLNDIEGVTPHENPATKAIFSKLFSALFPILIGLAVFLYLTHHSGSSNISSTTNSPSSAAIYLAQDAADGQFNFVVTTAPICGLSQVSDGNGNSISAQGQFCRIRLLVTNKSNTSADFFDSNQKLFDTNGNQYDVSTEADTTAADALIFQSINPGLKALGDIYFELPVGAVPDHIILHDSAFSGGVTVKLQSDPSLSSIGQDAASNSISSDLKQIDAGGKYFGNLSTINCPKGNIICANLTVESKIGCTSSLEITGGLIDQGSTSTWNTFDFIYSGPFVSYQKYQLSILMDMKYLKQGLNLTPSEFQKDLSGPNQLSIDTVKCVK